ncbi:MAG: folate-binding protein [Methyloglobulus sp.]|nr:folate-binding protein YgfZ [Methyloglobulus sp.]
MNLNWEAFLLNQQANIESGNHVVFPRIENSCNESISPVTHLNVLTVSGNDAAKLLQGQITCNVNDISEIKSSLAAICNPKGRAIATFLLVKKADTFLLILPIELLETVRKRLQMFVLRSDVKITDSSDELCLLGLCESGQPAKPFVNDTFQGITGISLPGLIKRSLLITDVDTAIGFYSEYINDKGFRLASSDDWRYLDIVSGIPWLTLATSEEFIPQMLNLDKLGGISFNKGCYTGQEIVARTHYLGKSKREMLLAECTTTTPPEPNATIINRDSNDQKGVGKVLLAHQNQGTCTMLVVLQETDLAYSQLALKDDTLTSLKLLSFQA